MSATTNTATIDGQGNIVIQNVEGSTISIGSGADPKALEKLEDLDVSVEVIHELVMQSLRVINKRLPKQLTVADIPQRLRLGSRHFYHKLRGKNGRLEHLEISEHILADISGVQTTTSLDNKGKIQTDLMQMLWQDEKPHTQVVGEGGMGKTVSMIWLWEQYLKPYEGKGGDNPIVIYVALNEYNNATAAVKEKFLTHYIAEHYLGIKVLENEIETFLWKWLEQPNDNGEMPKLILLLDGLNEITDDIAPLLIDLNQKWRQEAKERGIQIMVSSRFFSDHYFTRDFKPFELKRLNNYCICDYLMVHTKDLFPFTVNAEGDYVLSDAALAPLVELIRNPMMLSLYAQSTHQNQDQPYLTFKEEVNGSAELIWNFVENQLAKYIDENPTEEQNYIRFHFLIKYLLPYVAYEMEQKDVCEIAIEQLERVIPVALNRFHQPSFLQPLQTERKYLKQYRKYLSALQLGELPLVAQIQRFEQLLENFHLELFPVSLEGNYFRFMHESFRDFFAAKHLYNEITLALESGQLPNILKTRILPARIRIILGEMVGEHYNRLDQVPNDKDWQTYFNQTCLVKTLELCRGNYEKEKIGYTVWNIITIWKEVRRELSGADLSELQLDGISFNRTICSTFFRGTMITTRWDNAHLSPKQLFPQGHNKVVIRVRVSPNGKYLVSASLDHTIKVWSTETNQYLGTLQSVHGHHDRVNSLAISPDSTRVLSGSSDGILIEWSLASLQCLQVFRGHQDSIRDVDYHPEGQEVLSASKDGTIKQWSVSTGKCLQTFKSILPDLDENEKEQFLAVAYHPNGRSFFSGSVLYNQNSRKYSAKDEAGVLKEWSVETGELVKNYDQQMVNTLAFSPCRKKFVAGSLHGQLQEWSLETKNRIQSFRVPAKKRIRAKIYDVSYSPGGQHILVAGFNDQLHEWSVKTGAKTQSFIGHARYTTSVAFYPDGKKLYSGSTDATIKAWNSQSGQQVHTIQPSQSPINNFIPITKTAVLLGSEDGTLALWAIKPLGGPNCYNRAQLFDLIRGETTIFTLAALPQEQQVDPEQGVLGLLKSFVVGGKWGFLGHWSPHDKFRYAYYRDRPHEQYPGHQADISGLSFSANGQYLASADVHGHLSLWEMEKKAPLPLPKQEHPVTNLYFSPIADDNTFVTSDIQGQIMVWNTSQLEGPMQTFQHGPRVYTLAFNGKKILSGDAAGIIKEWDIALSQEAPRWKLDIQQKSLTTLDYHPTENRLLCAASDHILQEWLIPDTANEENIQPVLKQTFKGHKGWILAAKYIEHQGGEYICSASEDSTLKIWDPITGACLLTIENIPGLWVQGFKLADVWWTEPLTDREWELLAMYGADLGLKELGFDDTPPNILSEGLSTFTPE